MSVFLFTFSVNCKQQYINYLPNLVPFLSILNLHSFVLEYIIPHLALVSPSPYLPLMTFHLHVILACSCCKFTTNVTHTTLILLQVFVSQLRLNEATMGKENHRKTITTSDRCCCCCCCGKQTTSVD